MRRPLLLAAAGFVALGTLAAGAGARRDALIPVTLTASTRTLGLGQTVTFTARAASVPAGTRLYIVLQRQGTPSSKLQFIASCPASPCIGHMRETAPHVNIYFAAVVQPGANGSVLIRGSSKPFAVTWKRGVAPPPPTSTATTPPPPPPPPPSTSPPASALAGHYAGTTSQNESWAFDVSADGRTLLNFQSGQINESCTPSADLSQGRLSQPGPFPLNPDGSFTITVNIPITIGTSGGSVAGIRRFQMSGRLSGGLGQGSFRTDTTFQIGSTGFTCSSSNQTWSVTKS